MPATLHKPVVTGPDKSLVSVRPTMAKADIPDNTDAPSLSPLVKDAAKTAYGKQGAAAAQLAKDEGNFARDVREKRMTLGDMETLGAAFLVAFATGVLTTYGPLATPMSRAKQKVRDARSALDELDQLLEYLA